MLKVIRVPEARRRLPTILREAGTSRRVAIGRRGIMPEDFRRLKGMPAWLKAPEDFPAA